MNEINSEVEQGGWFIISTHPAQAEDIQWVRELSSRLVFSNRAAFTLEVNKITRRHCIWNSNFNYPDE